MSNSNFQNSYISFVKETTPGETPATPDMKKYRTTDPLAINPQKQVITSDQPYNHRQTVLNRHALKSVDGGLPFELSYGSFDAWLESVLGGEWSQETAGAEEVLKAGNLIHTFTVERGFPDIGEYEQFRGVIPNQLTINIGTDGPVTGNMQVLGMDYDPASETSLGEHTDVTTNQPFDGLGNARLHEGGESEGDEIGIVTSLEMTINNNRSVGPLVGSDAGDEPVNGAMEISGNLTARFKNRSLLNKFYNDLESLLKVRLSDQAGAEFIEILLPKIKYNGGQRQNSNNALDVNLPFVALYDDALATAIQLTRSNA